MCYSARVRAEHRDYERATGARLSIKEYISLFWEREYGSPYKTPKALDDAFMAPRISLRSARTRAITSATAPPPTTISAGTVSMLMPGIPETSTR